MWRTFICRGVTLAGLHRDNNIAASVTTRYHHACFGLMRARLERTVDGARGVGTTCDSAPPAGTARPSGTGNKSPVVRPAWACHAWTATARVKSEPKEKTLAPSQGSTGPARLGPGRQMAEASKRGDVPAVANQQCTEGTHQVGAHYERRRSKRRTTVAGAGDPGLCARGPHARPVANVCLRSPTW